MKAFDRCGRCGDYGWHPCLCRVVGRVWDPDNGETEDDAHELYSKHSTEGALQQWARIKHCEDWEMFPGDEATRDVAFRPTGGEIEIYTIAMSMQPSYRVDRADDDVVEEVEKRMAALAAG